MRIGLAQLDFIIGKKINWCAILWINDNDTKEAATFENKRTIFNGMDNKCKIYILQAFFFLKGLLLIWIFHKKSKYFILI